RGLPNASGAIATLVPVLNPQSTQTSVASNLVNPTIFQWNFNIQRELPGKFTMTLAYVGTRGERLFESDIINPFGGFAPGTTNTLPRINPLRGAITVRDNSGDSHYNGGSIKVERQYSHGLLLRGSYTYSKSIDDGSDVFNTFGTGDAGSVTPQNPFSRASNRGLSDFDIRHRAVFAYVWNIPGLRNSSNGLMNGLDTSPADGKSLAPLHYRVAHRLPPSSVAWIPTATVALSMVCRLLERVPKPRFALMEPS